MDDTCGGDDLNDVTLTFDDQATDRLHDNLGCTSGRFPPTSFAGVQESLPAPAPQLPYGDRLSAYDGASPNGTWRLFVFDDDDEDGGFLAQRPKLSITTVDVVAPDTSLTRHPHDTARRTAVLRFAATEAGSHFECKVDRHQFRPCDSPLQLKHLGVGRHRVSVRSVDLAGNVDPSPAVAHWRVQRR
jgi:hypothetical protein